jgi:hypothetical protein
MTQLHIDTGGSISNRIIAVINTFKQDEKFNINTVIFYI